MQTAVESGIPECLPQEIFCKMFCGAKIVANPVFLGDPGCCEPPRCCEP